MEIVEEFGLDQYFEVDAQGHLLHPKIDSEGIPPLKGLRKYNRAVAEMNPPPEDAYIPGIITIKFNSIPEDSILPTDREKKNIQKILKQYNGKITGSDDVDGLLKKHKALSIRESLSALFCLQKRIM